MPVLADHDATTFLALAACGGDHRATSLALNARDVRSAEGTVGDERRDAGSSIGGRPSTRRIVRLRHRRHGVGRVRRRARRGDRSSGTALTRSRIRSPCHSLLARLPVQVTRRIVANGADLAGLLLVRSVRSVRSGEENTLPSTPTTLGLAGRDRARLSGSRSPVSRASCRRDLSSLRTGQVGVRGQSVSDEVRPLVACRADRRRSIVPVLGRARRRRSQRATASGPPDVGGRGG